MQSEYTSLDSKNIQQKYFLLNCFNKVIYIPYINDIMYILVSRLLTWLSLKHCLVMIIYSYFLISHSLNSPNNNTGFRLFATRELFIILILLHSKEYCTSNRFLSM